MKLDDYINFHTLFITMCVVIAYKYIVREDNIILEKKL